MNIFGKHYTIYDLSPVNIDQTVTVLSKIFTAANISYKVSDSKSTNSKYIYLNKTKPQLKIRISDHKNMRGLIVEKALIVYKFLKGNRPS